MNGADAVDDDDDCGASLLQVQPARRISTMIKNVIIMLFLFNNENQRISWSHHRSVSLRSVSLHLPRIWNSESEILYKWTWSHRAK